MHTVARCFYSGPKKLVQYASVEAWFRCVDVFVCGWVRGCIHIMCVHFKEMVYSYTLHVQFVSLPRRIQI